MRCGEAVGSLDERLLTEVEMVMTGDGIVGDGMNDDGIAGDEVVPTALGDVPD